jgi:hypothetical protein
MPLARLPGSAVALRLGAPLVAELRRGSPPVIALLREDRVVLDVRCVADVQELAAAVASACERAAGTEGRIGATLGEIPSGEAPDGSEV